MFTHNLLELPTLTRIDGEMRHYLTPTGEKYPSVTTVLSKMSDKTALKVWKENVGEAKAEYITRRAGIRGTDVHALCEKYVMNEPLDMRNEMPLTKSLFGQIQRVMEPNVDNILFSEGFLYSHNLKIAGAADLAAEWKGTKAIIDFKTSVKLKKKEYITNYFLQASMYSYMLWEMTGIYCPKIVIIISVEEEAHAQVFEDSAKNWIKEAKFICENFHKNY